MMKKVISGMLIVFCCSLNILKAQDYTFSNHNIVPFSLNPSLAGNAYAMRLGLNYRMQWPSLGNRYNTVRASYDQNFYKRISSIGIAYTYDNMANIYKTNEFDVVYSHTFKVGDIFYVRLGLQGAVFMNYLDWSNLTFEDQYDSRIKDLLPNTIENIEFNSRTFPDFSFGATFVVEDMLSIGASICHIAEPKNGFAKLEENTLNRKFVVHANFVQDLESRRGLFSYKQSSNYFFANASYQQQKDFKLAYLGAGMSLNPILFGASVKYDMDAVGTISFMLGGQFKGLQAYYIYDLYTSQKKNGSWSHEISLIYIFHPEEKPYSCPVIYW